MDGRVQVFCNDFSFRYHPMETLKCSFKLGSAMFKVNFVWGGDGGGWKWAYILHKPDPYVVSGYTVTNVTWINPRKDMGMGIGFDVTLKRNVMPYVMQYYVPCCAIVLVSQISFIIPLSAIPGRVALLVTQFLTLTNIFIHQQVNNYCYT